MATGLESFVAVLEGASKIAWPTLAAVALWRVYPAVARVLESRGFKVKVGDMEITVQEASDQLATQVADLQKKVEALRSKLDERAKPMPATLAPAAAAAEAKGSPAGEPPPAARRILWVDDNPSNNAFEVARLRAEGIEVLEASSTEEGMRVAVTGRVPIAAIVTDMGRRENGKYKPKAGLELIRALRDAGVRVPVFVYSTAKYIERTREEVSQAAGNGATASPVELFEMIHGVIGDAG